jgi:threonine dehydratase
MVAAGQGTAAVELLEQVKNLDVVVIPIGGGGLIAGMAAAIKTLRPQIRIYGVEPEGAPSMRRSLDAGHAVRLESTKTIADGLAAPMAGEIAFDVVKRTVTDVVLVTDEAIVGAMRDLLLYAKLFTEPAGAAATAALLDGKVPVDRGERVAAVVRGANMDIGRLCGMIGA